MNLETINRAKLRIVQRNGPILQVARAIKRCIEAIDLQCYKLALIVVRKLHFNPKGRKRILLTGDAGEVTGPVVFLTNICTLLRPSYDIALSFPSSQITPALISMCRKSNLRLIARPKLPDLLDIFVFWFITLLTRANIVLVNVGTFGRNVHLVAPGTPNIYYSHSIWHREISDRVRWTLSTFLDESHRIVTVSKAAYDSLKNTYFENGGTAKYLSWIHNWVPTTGNAAVTRKVPEETTVVLTLGTVATYKNPNLWVNVAKKVLKMNSAQTRVEFWWAGKGPLLEAGIQAAGSEERIRFLGFVAEPEKLFARAAIYFQPSEFESFGLAVCEAMMFGLPCVVTDCGGPTELVEHGENGFVVSNFDEDELVERIQNLISDKVMRVHMGQRSRDRYMAKFTEKQWGPAFESLVHSIRNPI